MELVIIAAAIMLGLGALGAAVGMGLLGWKVDRSKLLVSQSLVQCCRARCFCSLV